MTVVYEFERRLHKDYVLITKLGIAEGCDILAGICA